MKPRVLIIEPAIRNYMSEGIIDALGTDDCEVVLKHDPQSADAELREADVLVSMFGAATTIERAPRLRAIVNPYTGSEHIDRSAANARGLIIGKGQTPENVVGMAEATILLLLNAFYDLEQARMVLWENAKRPTIRARMLAGKTIGLIGYGLIAQAVAARLAAWEATILTSAPRVPDGTTVARHVELEWLLEQSDAVLVLCSLNESTRNLIDARRLAMMKLGAVIVNTARGGIIDEDALCDAVEAGHIGRVALDAFAVEPLPMTSRLRNLKGAVLTPHMIGHTMEAEHSMQQTAAESVRRVLAGRPPMYVLNPETLPSWLERHGRSSDSPERRAS